MSETPQRACGELRMWSGARNVKLPMAGVVEAGTGPFANPQLQA